MLFSTTDRRHALYPRSANQGEFNMFGVCSGWGALTILLVAIVAIRVGAIVQLAPCALAYPQLARCSPALNE
jgi:hypothetical protein